MAQNIQGVAVNSQSFAKIDLSGNALSSLWAKTTAFMKQA